MPVASKLAAQNIGLATAVHAGVISRFKFEDLGIHQVMHDDLAGCNRPAIVFFGGFVTHEKECLLIASDNYRDAVSEAIGDALINFQKALAERKGKPTDEL